MTRQTDAPLAHVSLHAGNRSAREVARLADSGQLDLEPPYQRGSVWTLDQRIALIRSWCQGIPVGAVTINDRGSVWWADANGSGPLNNPGGKGLYAAVDGKQRIMTAQMWFNGELAVPASWFNGEDVAATEDTDDGPYVRYTGLSLSRQRGMGMGFLLPVMEAQLPTQAEEADLFLLLNGGGTPQTPQDMDNAARHASSM